MNSKKRTTVGSGKRKQTAPATLRFNPHTLLTQIGDGRTVLNYKEGQAIFAQGDPVDAIFYIQKGGVKLTAVSKPGREAVLAFRKLGFIEYNGGLQIHSSLLNVILSIRSPDAEKDSQLPRRRQRARAAAETERLRASAAMRS